jgi:hypothetical protein
MVTARARLVERGKPLSGSVITQPPGDVWTVLSFLRLRA